MSGVSQQETFSLTWKVKNYHLSNRKTGSYLNTLNFKVGTLKNTMWQLLLAPAGITDPLFMGCALMRVSSEEEPESVWLNWKICVIAEGGALRFETRVRSFLPRNKSETVSHFIRKSELLPTDTPQNNLTIYCEMINDRLYNSKLDLQYDLETLSSDLAGLLESGFRSDFKMYCRGEIFNVHKFILFSRWPEISERLEMYITPRDDIIMTGIDPSTLHSLLTFLYTGKLQREDISMELCSYMHEHDCDVLIDNLETPFSSLEFVTHLHHEWKHLTWDVGEEESWEHLEEGFFRVIPLEEVYPSEMVMVFDFEKRNGEEWFVLSVFFTGFTPVRPILLDGEISFLNKNAVVCSRKFHYLLESGDKWCLPYLVKKSDLYPNPSKSKCVEIDLCICDGSLDTRLVSSNISNASRSKEVKNLRQLRADLLKSHHEKDLKFKIGGHSFYVHSPIVAARSEKFRELIPQNGGIIEIEGCSDAKAAESFVSHLYGGRLLNLDVRNTLWLNSVAQRFSLDSLEKKTRNLLLEHQNGG